MCISDSRNPKCLQQGGIERDQRCAGAPPRSTSIPEDPGKELPDDRILYYDTTEGKKTHRVTTVEPHVRRSAASGTSRGISINGFANDVGIVVEARNTKLLELHINDTLRKVGGWLAANGLEAAEHKTECTLLTRKRVIDMLIFGKTREVRDQNLQNTLNKLLGKGLRLNENVCSA